MQLCLGTKLKKILREKTQSTFINILKLGNSVLRYSELLLNKWIATITARDGHDMEKWRFVFVHGVTRTMKLYKPSHLPSQFSL